MQKCNNNFLKHWFCPLLQLSQGPLQSAQEKQIEIQRSRGRTVTSSLIQTLMIYPAVRSLVMHTRGRAVWGNHSNWPSYSLCDGYPVGIYASLKCSELQDCEESHSQLLAQLQVQDPIESCSGKRRWGRTRQNRVWSSTEETTHREIIIPWYRIRQPNMHKLNYDTFIIMNNNNYY